MTKSADLHRDLHSSEENVKISNDTVVRVEGYDSRTVVFPNKAGGITVRLEKVAYLEKVALSLIHI